MFQRIMALTAVASVFLISILFLFILMGMRHSMADEQERTERYILSTAGNAVHTIRNEILFLFENYSEEIGQTDFSLWNGDIEALGLEEVHQLDDFPSVVKDTFFIDPDEISRHLSEDAHGGSMPFYREFLGHLNDITINKNLSIINIYDLEGYMAFPINGGAEGETVGFLVFFLDLRNVVGEYMPARLMMELEMSERRNKRDTEQEYLILLKKGRDIVPTERQFLIDLNRDFNLFNVQDYYYTRPDAFVPLMKNNTITANHSYLVIYHREAEPGAFMRKKIRNYSILVFLYLFLVGVLLLFLYSVYRIRREYQREQGFTSLISHELKTPLSVIQLASESLAGGFVTEKEDVTEYGAMIKGETNRLGRMIENILLVSTLSWTGRRYEPVSLEDLLSEIYEENRPLLQKRAVLCDVENRMGSLMFQTHGSLLKAALQNLIHNGIIYGADRSADRKIIFRVEPHRAKCEGILFSLIDHGPGVSRSEATKIFDPYFRGKNIRENQLPGSGMGLALSRRIAEGLGGRLQLNRSVRGETVFELWIPLRKGNEENTDD